MKIAWRATLIGAVSFLVAGCDNGPRPWIGYATNKAKGTLEYWWSEYATREDCLFDLERGVSTWPNNQWYSTPVGCTIRSNDYWVVWLDVIQHGGRDVACIARWISADAASSKTIYTVIIAGAPERQGDGWYCV